MGACNCCLPRSGTRDENALLREGTRRQSIRTRQTSPSDRIVIDVGILEEDHSNPVEQTWLNDIHSVWAIKPSSLAIHTDLPRLVRKCSIFDSNGVNITPDLEAPAMVPMKQGQVIPAAIGEDSKMRRDEIIVLNFLLALSKALGDDYTYNHLEANFWDFFPRQEMSGPLRTWLIDIESKTGEDVPPTLKVLKVANQRVMFPAYWCLKSKLRLANMRDKRGTWHMNFMVHSDRVEVIHTKTQMLDNQTVALKEEGEFEVALVLKISSPPECDTLTSIHMEIRNLVLAADLTPEARDAWQSKFDNNHFIR